jgi:F-type H+-transporting ATPase subunit epsilon
MKIEIVTPEALFYSGEAEMVVLPGVSGEFAVLPLHIPFISMLQAGLVKINLAGHNELFFVTEGFVDINDSCIILCEDIYNLRNLDKKSISAKLESAKLIEDETKREKEILIASRMLVALEDLAEHKLDD